MSVKVSSKQHTWGSRAEPLCWCTLRKRSTHITVLWVLSVLVWNVICHGCHNSSLFKSGPWIIWSNLHVGEMMGCMCLHKLPNHESSFCKCAGWRLLVQICCICLLMGLHECESSTSCSACNVISPTTIHTDTEKYTHLWESNQLQKCCSTKKKLQNLDHFGRLCGTA